MTNRLSIDQINSDGLDALYAEIDRLTAELSDYDRRVQTLEHVAAGNKRHVQLILPDLERAEATLARIEALAEEYPVGIDTALIHEALAHAEPAPNPAATDTTELEKTTRVIDLYERWLAAGPPPLGTSISRWWDRRLIELHNAIRPAAEQPTTTVNNPATSNNQP